MSLPYEHASRRGDAVHLRIIAGRRVDEFLGYHAVVNDLLIGIDVVQIGVQRLHTLLKACFKTVELIGFDDARHGIIGEQPIVIFAVLVYAGTHTVAAELAIDLLAPGYQSFANVRAADSIIRPTPSARSTFPPSGGACDTNERREPALP